MTKIHRKHLLLAKKELVYGTNSVPTGAANAMECMDLSIEPLAGGTVEHKYARGDLGSNPAVQVDSHQRVTFGIALAGGGAVDTPPAYADLLLACGMAETITAATMVEYTLVSTDPDSVSMLGYKDGTQHTLLGSRGNTTLVFPPNDIPRFNFEFTGLYAPPTAVANPAVNYAAFQTPLPVSDTNTSTFTLFGFAGTLESLELNLGNQVQHRDRPGSQVVIRTDRQGTGRISIESTALGAHDFFADARAGTEGILQIVHGTVAGNTVQVDAKIQILNPRYAESQGVEVLEMDLRLVPVAGDDELKITTK